MKIAASLHPRVWNHRSVMGYLPGFSLVCLVVSRTALQQTRYAGSVLGFGLGTLSAYVVADLVRRVAPEAFAAREAGENELVGLGLR